ncbi:MAG: hypothetical protein AAGA48_14235 [Myxococcota bacterium]
MRFAFVHLVLAGLTTACTNNSEVCPHAPDADTDEDGLLDCEEFDFGTAVHLADSDGDGFSDFQEIVEFGFSPENNNFKFNPLIADVPKIGVEVTSPPEIEAFFTSSIGEEITETIGNSDTFGETVSTSNTSTQSHAVEFGISTGGSVTVGAKIGFPSFGSSVEATVFFETSVATTQESSFSFSREQSQSKEQTFSESLSNAISEESTFDGGRLAVTTEIYNAGDISFTLQSVILSALMTTPTEQEILRPIGNLDFDSSDGDLDPITFAPGQRIDQLIFSNDRLGTGTIQALSEDASNLDIRITAYELVNENGQAFSHNQTEVQAKTATILLDFGPGRPIERYSVSTNIDESRLRINARQAMADILRVPYTINEAGELESIREVDRNQTIGGFWAVIHQTTDGVNDILEFSGPDDPPLDFNEISLQSGDVLHLMYYADRDSDGLGEREELAIGSNENSADTDGDSILDAIEVREHKTSPVDRDTDDDCIDDGVEIGSGTDPRVADSGQSCPEA